MISALRARLTTLRWRLTLFYCGLLAVLLLGLGLFVYTLLDSSLRAAAEHQLRDQATYLTEDMGIGTFTEAQVDGQPGAADKLRVLLISQRARYPTTMYIALLDATGQPMVTNDLSEADLLKLKLLEFEKPRNGPGADPKATDLPVTRAPVVSDFYPALPTQALLNRAATDKAGTLYETTLQQVATAGGTRTNGIALLLAIRSPDPQNPKLAGTTVTGYLQLATSRADAETALTTLAALLLIGLLGAVGLALLFGLPLARLGLRPLTEMAATATRIGGGDLTRRVRVPGRVTARAAPTDEVQQLALAFNTMLDQIEAAFRAQQQSEARTRQFAADASHELRSPLTVLGGYLEVLQMGAKDDSAQAARILQAMQRENDRLGRLVVDLLLLTRIDANGAAQLHSAPLPLAEVVTRAADNMRLLAGARTLVLTHDATTPGWMRGDADHLYRVLVNLIDNAIRYTGPDGTITLALDHAPARGDPAAPSWLRLRVSDDGCGIAPEDLSHIFDRFYRADPSRARQTGNAGLGLAIARSIVEAHGGLITVASTPDAGTCFTLLLPSFPAPGGDRFSANSQALLRLPQAPSATLDIVTPTRRGA